MTDLLGHLARSALGQPTGLTPLVEPSFEPALSAESDVEPLKLEDQMVTSRQVAAPDRLVTSDEAEKKTKPASGLLTATEQPISRRRWTKQSSPDAAETSRTLVADKAQPSSSMRATTEHESTATEVTEQGGVVVPPLAPEPETPLDVPAFVARNVAANSGTEASGRTELLTPVADQAVPETRWLPNRSTEATTIKVTIGRVEVRAAAASPPPAPVKARSPQPKKVSLSDYLARRSRLR